MLISKVLLKSVILLQSIVRDNTFNFRFENKLVSYEHRLVLEILFFNPLRFSIYTDIV